MYKKRVKYVQGDELIEEVMVPQYSNGEPPWFYIDDSNIYFTGEITPSKGHDIIKYITIVNALPKEERPDVINLKINTHGGCMETTFAMISCMKASRVPVRTIAIGSCASGGLMLALSGVERYVDKYCSIMSHTLSTGYPESSKPADLQRWLDDVQSHKQKIVDLYVEYTKLSEGDVKKHLLPEDGDVYLTAKQALGFNLFDEYFSSYDQIMKD